MSGTSAPTTARKNSAEKSIPHTRIQDDSMIKDNYEVGEKIGQGNFGKVYEATHKATGVKWAIKSINKEKAGSSALKLVEREVTILKRVNHPNIINLKEIIESPKRMYLVMEICTEGELADRVKEKRFSESETKQIMSKLASAVSYLHKHGIVHRDIKLENILMAQNPEDENDKLHIKVTDFGLSVVKGGVTPDSMMQDFCGTPIYMAPEILDNKTYSQQCDVWAMGIIMYTLICGYPPFRAKDEATLYDLIREANPQFDDDVWSSISEECKNCILGMLKLDPAHRLSASEVLNHPWITGQERDTSQPTNVLEMMKMWKDELKHDTGNSLDGDDNIDSPDTDKSKGSRSESRRSSDTKDSTGSKSLSPGHKTVKKTSTSLLSPKAASRSTTPSGGSSSRLSTTGNGVNRMSAVTPSHSKISTGKAKKK
ncbi:hypothetical protein ACOMHN_018095 [Nucella lapillus]